MILGTKVHFIDYGNESYSTDLRKLPENLEKIERASVLCTLESDNDEFTSDFVNKFTALDLDKEYEFEIVTESLPRIVRLYVDGELFADGKLDRNIVPKNGQIKANSDSIMNETIASSSDQRSVAGMTDDNYLNGTNGTSNSTFNDTAAEADRIEKAHFNRVESIGMGFNPA